MAVILVADTERVIAVVDEPLGRLQLRRSGIAIPHKGLRELIAVVGPSFPRLCLGIGPVGQGLNVSTHVRRPFEADQEPLVEKVVAYAAEAVAAVLKNGLRHAIQKYGNEIVR